MILRLQSTPAPHRVDLRRLPLPLLYYSLIRFLPTVHYTSGCYDVLKFSACIWAKTKAATAFCCHLEGLV